MPLTYPLHPLRMVWSGAWNGSGSPLLPRAARVQWVSPRAVEVGEEGPAVSLLCRHIVCGSPCAWVRQRTPCPSPVCMRGSPPVLSWSLRLMCCAGVLEWGRPSGGPSS